MITPSQTVGPFFSFSLTAKPLGKMRQTLTTGEPIRLVIRLLDGAGAPIPDGIIELWQADSSGKYSQPGGFGRMGTDATGTCVFETIRPGKVPFIDGKQQAPHINVIVLARGMLLHLFTRIYFEGDPANGQDAVLALIPAERRRTL